MKTRIVLVSPTPPLSGGIANWTKIIHRLAKEKGVDIAQISTNPRINAYEHPNLFLRAIYGIQNKRKCAKELKNIINHQEIDAVHIASSGSLSLYRDIKLLKICKKNKITSIFHLRIGNSLHSLQKSFFIKVLMKKVAKLSDFFIVLDSKTKEGLESIFQRPILSIPNLII